VSKLDNIVKISEFQQYKIDDNPFYMETYEKYEENETVPDCFDGDSVMFEKMKSDKSIADVQEEP
jgi:hypothetical protein